MLYLENFMENKVVAAESIETKEKDGVYELVVNGEKFAAFRNKKCTRFLYVRCMEAITNGEKLLRFQPLLKEIQQFK